MAAMWISTVSFAFGDVVCPRMVHRMRPLPTEVRYQKRRMKHKSAMMRKFKIDLITDISNLKYDFLPDNIPEPNLITESTVSTFVGNHPHTGSNCSIHKGIQYPHWNHR